MNHPIARKTLWACLTIALVSTACAHGDTIPVLSYRVVHTYPHDPTAFTEGLFYEDGFFYESTGEFEGAGVRKVNVETGEIVQRRDTPSGYFGEGIIDSNQRILQLSWQQGVGFIYDKATFKLIDQIRYPGEGWAMTRDADHIYMSDGTPVIRILDPQTFAQTGSISVTADGEPLQMINELEWVKGKIYANVWQTARIAQIDPKTGHVVGWIDMTKLVQAQVVGDPANDVLNGIAYDAAHDRLFVTGKRWKSVYEVRVER